jgi:hypothetical protein
MREAAEKQAQVTANDQAAKEVAAVVIGKDPKAMERLQEDASAN